MEAGSRSDAKSEPDFEDSTDQQSGTSAFENSVIKFSNKDDKTSKNMPLTPKGVENAKKRLRAFSIQKKSSLSPISLPKPVNTGVATVLVGKACGMKTVPKPDPDPVAELKKPPKPPKPGAKQVQESYILTQKKTLGEIEDMKRKMELVELGIPLGLICPTPNSDKAMPTKAMPPIKSFIEPAKVDELIREAKKAKAEGKEFKFDYRKLLPDYDNPFQRKKEEVSELPKVEEFDTRKSRDKNPRRSDKYDSRRHSFHKKNEKDKARERPEVKERRSPKDRDGKSRDKDFKYRDSKSKDRRDIRPKESDNRNKEKRVEVKKNPQKGVKEADVNLKDFVVCDSWSDNEEKSKDSTPKTDEMKKTRKEKTPVIAKIDRMDPLQQLRESLIKKDTSASPKPKLERLNPVRDSFKFEIEEPEEDEILDIFDENSSLEKFSKIKSKKEKIFDSPLDVDNLFELDSKDETIDEADDTFLESVINEIKQEDIDDASQDKGLVEYDESPTKDDDGRMSVTPEMDDRLRELHSSRSDYSDGYKSVESARSIESGYKSTDSLKLSEDLKSVVEIEKVIEERKMAKYTVDSLETWSFVLKICQPLLFRHDKNKCYKETRMTPKVWFTENPKLCNCVKDRRVVYEELEMCKSELVNSLCAAKQVPEAAYPTARGWYPSAAQCLVGSSAVLSSMEWEAEDSQPRATPERDISLDKEYQRFMQAVWPEVAEPKSETPRTTPVRREVPKRPDDDLDLGKLTPKRMKTTSEGWSQESDVEEEVDKSTGKKLKTEKLKRKRKHSPSTSVTDSSESEAKKRKKMQKKDKKKTLSKEAKRRRVIKKSIKKLKDKQNKKKKKREEEENFQDIEKEKKKKEKRTKKKKQLKQKKKKNQKKKKAKAKNVSSSSSSESSSDSESETEKKKKKRKSEKKKKRKRSSSASTQEELFDVNILNNIKTERITDDETKKLEFSPRKQKPREIINVKELQNDFVGNSIQIKKEVEEEEQKSAEVRKVIEEEKKAVARVEKQEEESQGSQSEVVSEEKEQQPEFKEQDESQSTPQLPPEESNQSQCSSQESICSLKDHPVYEKDESHLRPSSQNSNYSFHDVISSGMYKNVEHGMDEPSMPRHDMQRHDMQRHDHSMELDSQENYEQGNYEMYEQMAMAYQSDVASQQTSPPSTSGEQRIETVVRARTCGEIKCDWRAGDSVAAPPARPSRWGLKPGDVNIVLTGGGEQYPIQSVVEPVYKIQSLANRTDTTTIGYDEAYMDMYGASDKLQYGDCFSSGEPQPDTRRTHSSSLDDRINLALKTTVLGQVAKDVEANEEKDVPEKGILVTKSLAVPENRAVKRVSFADGYKPGQDSDVEEPPVKKKKKSRVFGCAWPCPATHPDHVPLWDALPPPPPPPGSPPPPRAAPPAPAHLLRRPRPQGAGLGPAPHGVPHKFDPNTMPAFMPPEPPPGIISFQNL